MNFGANLSGATFPGDRFMSDGDCAIRLPRPLRKSTVAVIRGKFNSIQSGRNQEVQATQSRRGLGDFNSGRFPSPPSVEVLLAVLYNVVDTND